jgi:hypothetical protein
MSERPENIWRRPVRGWAKLTAWWLILVVASFGAIFSIGWVSFKFDVAADWALISFAFALSVGVATLLGGGLWFIRWLACWRNLRRFLAVFASFATLIAVFYAEEDWRGRRAWKKYVRQQEAKGEKMDFAALIPPPIPDDQNFALCPLLKPLLDYTVRSEPPSPDDLSPRTRWLDTNGLARFHRLDLHRVVDDHLATLSEVDRQQLWERARVKEIKAQVEANALTNGWINLVIWRDYFQIGTNLHGANPSNSPAQDVLIALRDVEPDLAELRLEAGRRPLARWAVHYDTSSPWGILMPHLSWPWKIFMLLQVRASALLAANRTDEGFADIELGIRLAESYAGEPFVISQLVRIQRYQMILQPVKEGQARHQFSDAQLAALQEQLQPVDMLAAYQSGWRGGRAIFGLLAKWSRTQWIRSFQDVFGSSDENKKQFRPYVAFVRIAPKGWIYQNLLAACRTYDNFIDGAFDVRTRTMRSKNIEAISDAKREGRGPYSALIHLITQSGKGFGDVLNSTRFAFCQTQIDLARVACALERYRLAHGQYPETLEAIAPRFIAQLPHDVINGQPFKYRRLDDDRFILYSVGWNETDDGGRVVFKKDGGKVNMMEGDWAWSYPSK